jgi:UDP-glucuronate 4-epimerase
MPFSVHQSVEHPLSLYAASKKSNEMMAHAYSHLFNIPTTGLRFFTVYGPWGRPDMAILKFIKAILAGEKIQIFNYGGHRRDFTYIDDIIESIICVLDQPAKPNLAWSGAQPDSGTSANPWCVYNVGSSGPIKLLDCVKIIEKALGKKAEIEMLPLQHGDVLDTYADTADLVQRFNFKPAISIELGVAKTVAWYLDYYKESPLL